MTVPNTAPAASPKPAPRRTRHGIASVIAGLAVLGVTGSFVVYAAHIGGRHHGASYPLQATFLSANGLAGGADVLLAGVPVGEVTSISLDRSKMVSRVRFSLDQAIHLPEDSRLSIGSPSMTAANALMIEPGHSSTLLAPNGVLTDTCEAVSLEDQVSRYIFGNGGASAGC